MSRVHVRCKKCDARRVLKKQPQLYLRIPKCESCGCDEYYVSHWMNRRDTKAMACCCKGYVPLTNKTNTVWEIHRKGSKYCWFRKNGSQRMEEDSDFRDLLMEMNSYNPNKEF